MGSQGGIFTKRVDLSLLLFLGSLGFSVFLWIIGFPFFFLFLIIPLIPFFRHNHEFHRCPVCGWETSGNERYCPYDGVQLDRVKKE